MSRFQIEERIGCIAIIDTEHVEYINNRSPGMSSALPYVVWYSNGTYDDDANGWRVTDSVKLEAQDRLNYFKKLIGEPLVPTFIEYKVFKMKHLEISKTAYDYIRGVIESQIGFHTVGHYHSDHFIELDEVLKEYKGEKVILQF